MLYLTTYQHRQTGYTHTDYLPIKAFKYLKRQENIWKILKYTEIK